MTDPESLRRRYTRWLSSYEGQEAEMEKKKEQKKKYLIADAQKQQTDARRFLSPIVELQLSVAIKSFARCNLGLHKLTIISIAEELAKKNFSRPMRWLTSFTTRHDIDIRNMKQISYARTDEAAIQTATEAFIKVMDEDIAKGKYVGKGIAVSSLFTPQY